MYICICIRIPPLHEQEATSSCSHTHAPTCIYIYICCTIRRWQLLMHMCKHIYIYIKRERVMHTYIYIYIYIYICFVEQKWICCCCTGLYDMYMHIAKMFLFSRAHVFLSRNNHNLMSSSLSSSMQHHVFCQTRTHVARIREYMCY